MLTLLCAASVCAPFRGEECSDPMSTRDHGRVIDANPLTFDPAEGQPGDIVVDMSGAVRGAALIARSGPTTNVLQQLLPAAGKVTDVWTPGAGGSGDGVLALTLVNNVDNAAQTGMIEVAFHSTANIAALAISGGLGSILYITGAGTPDMLIRVQTTAGGLASIAVDGTAAADLTYSYAPISPPGTGRNVTVVLP